MPRKKVEYDRENTRTYGVLREIRSMGTSRVEIECPFCLSHFWGYLWSLAGGGKKCPNCGALHVWLHRKAYPVVK